MESILKYHYRDHCFAKGMIRGRGNCHLMTVASFLKELERG